MTSRQTISLWRGKIRLKGELVRPKPGPLPLVVLFHGILVDSHREPIRSAKEHFQSLGFATLAFDFNGHGQSGGDFIKMTVANKALDGRVILDYAKGLDDITQLFLFGHSQGGVVASLIAPDYPQIKGLILLAPAGNIKASCHQGQLVDGHFDPDEVPPVIPAMGTLIGRDYILAGRDLEYYQAAAEFPEPALVIHGSGDTMVPAIFGRHFAQRFPKGSYRAIAGADHNFKSGMAQALKLAGDFFLSLL